MFFVFYAITFPFSIFAQQIYTVASDKGYTGGEAQKQEKTSSAIIEKYENHESLQSINSG